MKTIIHVSDWATPGQGLRGADDPHRARRWWATKVAGQLCQAERMAAHVHTRPVDHTPLVTAPADVVDIILDAARDVAAAT